VPKLNDDALLGMYRMMVLLRRFEERAGQAYGQRKIQGFCHLYNGQEAVAVGAQYALEADDYMMTGYRDHAHPIARGADPRMIMAELFGRYGGYSKGRGGSMHMFDIEHHFYGGYGIVGGQIPLAAGMAFASRYRNEKRVTVCFFGDAAANQGSFHETFNMAAKWKLPVIYVVENNRYGMGTDIRRVSAEPEIHKRASAYQMRGEAVDGMDVLKVHDVVKDCADWCRAGKGPVLLEANCYRYRGHSMSDAATYRTKEEVEKERAEKDPIARHREYLLKKKLATEAQLDSIDEEVKKQCDEAVAFADQSPEPPMEELYGDHYVEPGDPDSHPRERVLGATDVKWPSYPSGQELKVTWDLEPKEPKQVVTELPRKGAA
jgi:pyruvate dehydrogenase E1 component alpha subunit